MSFIYSQSDLHRRRERVQELMKKEHLDALILTNVENFIYFVGLSGAFGMKESYDRAGIAVLPAEGEPICVVAANQTTNILPVVKEENIRIY